MKPLRLFRFGQLLLRVRVMENICPLKLLGLHTVAPINTRAPPCSSIRSGIRQGF